MTNSITPPPELSDEQVGNWLIDAGYPWDPSEQRIINVARQAFQAGADRELEACCEWADETGWQGAGDGLRAARRKPPSLKEQALERCNDYIDPDGIIRRALEALPDD